VKRKRGKAPVFLYCKNIAIRMRLKKRQNEKKSTRMRILYYKYDIVLQWTKINIQSVAIMLFLVL